jgi:hypothetical protein
LEKEKLARAGQYEEQEWARVDEDEEVEEDGNPGSHDGWYDHDVKGKKGWMEYGIGVFAAGRESGVVLHCLQ